MKKTIFILFFGLLGGVAEGRSLSSQGVLSDQTGTPLNGEVQIVFRLYDTPEDPTPLWEEVQAVSVENGFYSVPLGKINPLSNDLLMVYDDLYLGVTIGSDSEMKPRMSVFSVPSAMVSERAKTADTLSEGAGLPRLVINGFGVVIDERGNWVGPPMIGTASPPSPAGPVGPAGPAGPQGAEGVKGETGLAGQAGLAGPQGAAGVAGPVGPEGPVGLMGPAGAQGSQGQKGDTGSAGLQGPKGDTGATGATGATGPAGPQGPAGVVPSGQFGVVAITSGNTTEINNGSSAQRGNYVQINNTTVQAGSTILLTYEDGDADLISRGQVSASVTAITARSGFPIRVRGNGTESLDTDGSDKIHYLILNP